MPAIRTASAWLHLLAVREPLKAPQLAMLRSELAASHVPGPFRQRLEQTGSPVAHCQSLAGLVLLARAVPAQERDGGLRRLYRDAHGRPMLDGGPFFSISHTRGLVGCVLCAEHPIGLDLEHRRPVQANSMARFLPDPAPAAPTADDLLAAWNAREAVVKATGRVGLARIAAVTLRADHAWLDGRRWQLHRPDAPAADFVCVAAEVALDITVVPHRLDGPLPD